MKKNQIIDLLNTAFQILELDILIKECEEKMKKRDESGQCDQGTP